MAKSNPQTPWTLFLVGMGLLVLGGGGLLRMHDRQASAQSLPVTTVQLAQHTYTVELARSEQEHAIGLMFRNHMDTDKGMLFVYQEEQPMSFWMKNTKIPLDILFFDRHWRLVKAHENVQPCTADPCPGYPSGDPAQYVLELAAGQAKTIGLEPGQALLAPVSTP